MEWQYDVANKTYVDEAGRRLSEATLTDLRDSYLDSAAKVIDDYATNLSTNAWTISTFEAEMRKRLKNAHIAEYVLGRGGASQMTPSDWGRIGATLKQQYKYLRSFLDDIENGTETKGQAANRGRNFLGAARQSFSRGRGRSYGLDLPAHPGDGGTECHGNCKCGWDIQEDDDEWRAYWQVSSNNPCEGCVRRGREYQPYVQEKPKDAAR